MSDARLPDGRRLATGTWDWDLRSQTVRFNGFAATILGAEENAVTSSSIVRPYQDRIVEGDFPKVAQALLAMTLRGEQYHALYRVHDLAGGRRRVLAQGNAVRDGDGNPVMLFGMMTDVTDAPEGAFDMPNRHDLIADNVISARSHSLAVKDSFLTHLLDMTLLHLADSQRVKRTKRDLN